MYDFPRPDRIEDGIILFPAVKALRGFLLHVLRLEYFLRILSAEALTVIPRPKGEK